MPKITPALTLALLILGQLASAIPDQLHALDLRTGKLAEISTRNPTQQGTVMVFLSAVCPCSESHQLPLAELAAKYPNFMFIGVHSNSDESIADALAFFKKAKLPFPVIQDEGGLLAKELGAFKTPHAFVIDPHGQVLFRGGLDNSHEAPRATKHYLAMALDAIVAGEKPKPSEVAPLGCIIN